MDDGTTVLEPAIEAREVIESFLWQSVLVPDWQNRLLAASADLVEAGRLSDDEELTKLGGNLRELAHAGIRRDDQARQAAVDIERILQAIEFPAEPF